LVVKSRNGFATVREMKYMLHNTGVTKQWTKKWPYIANVVLRIVHNLVKKITFVDFRGGGDLPSLDPPLH